jgi:transposase
MICVLDVHKETVLALVADGNGAEQGHQRLNADRQTMREYIGGLPGDSTVIMESCYAWEYIYDLASERGMDAIVANTGALYPGGKPEKKNDLEDCRRILRLHKIGELPAIHVLDSRIRTLRDLLRQRMFVTRKITSFRNRTHFQVDRLGLRLPNSELFGAEKTDPSKLEIGRADMVQIASNQRILDALEAEEKALESELVKQLALTTEIKTVLTMPGVGFILASTMVLEIGHIGRFPAMENLTAYAGLVPRLDISDGKEGPVRLRKHCNKNLRWAAIEAARHAIQCDAAMRQRYLRRLGCQVEMATKERKAKAVVAVARHLLEVVWCMLTRGEVYRTMQSTVPEKKMRKITRKGKAYRIPEAETLSEKVGKTLQKETDLIWSPSGHWEGGWDEQDASQPSSEEDRAAGRTGITPASIFL